MEKPLIILGSSRSEGNTRHLVDAIFRNIDHELIDLNYYHINYYTYDNRYTDDDFLSLAERMVQHRHIVFATPVYWYAMSAILKTYFDRMTDLVTIRKDLGRALKNKTLHSISCGSDEDLPEGFGVPFEATSVYLNMNYGGHFHGWLEQGEIPPIVRDKMPNFVQNF